MAGKGMGEKGRRGKKLMQRSARGALAHSGTGEGEEEEEFSFAKRRVWWVCLGVQGEAEG